MCLSTTQILRTGTSRAMVSQKNSVHRRFTCTAALARPSLPLNLPALVPLWVLVGTTYKELAILQHPMPYWRRWSIVWLFSVDSSIIMSCYKRLVLSDRLYLHNTLASDKFFLGNILNSSSLSVSCFRDVSENQDAQSLCQTATSGKTHVQT